ncbi:hypothetical protein ACRRTK_022571 [Alexandromys fortis]
MLVTMKGFGELEGWCSHSTPMLDMLGLEIMRKSKDLMQCIDILHRLGLGGKDVRDASPVTAVPSSPTPLPQRVQLTEFGVTLKNNAYIESPLMNILPVSLRQPLTVLIGLQSRKVNNAFLFSIRNNNRLQLGVQLLPKKLIVHVGGKQSVVFNYSVHDERWHSLAITVRDRVVSMFVECGKRYFSGETASEVQTFDSHSVFTLGSMYNNSVHFEGTVCQLYIIPSTAASTDYCRYMKQQCPRADTSQAETSLPHSAVMPTRHPEHTPLPKGFGETELPKEALTDHTPLPRGFDKTELPQKSFTEHTPLPKGFDKTELPQKTFSDGKDIPNIRNNNSSTVQGRQEYQTSWSQLTSFHSENASAVTLPNYGLQAKEIINKEETNLNPPVAFRDHMEILGYLDCQVQRAPKEILGFRLAKLLLEKRVPKDIQGSPDSVGNKVFRVTLETEALLVWMVTLASKASRESQENLGILETRDNQVTQDPRDHLALQDQR